jgi:hypothetical protein
MSINQSSSISPQAVIELISQMTTYEKEELSKLLGLKSIEKTDQPENGRRRGDPKFYLGTTPKGLNLEIPIEKFAAVFLLFLEEISPKKIEISSSYRGEFKETQFALAAFQDLMKSKPEYFCDRNVLIEMDDNEIVSSGGECLSIILSPTMMRKRNELASKIAAACGYTHQFKRGQFYAIVWEDEMEIREK